MYTIIRIMHCNEYRFEVRNGILHQIEIGSTLVASCNGRYFDLLDEVELEKIERNQAGHILNDVYENTSYIENIVPYEETTDEMLKLAVKIIKRNVKIDELKTQKKIITFPQKKL